MQTKELIGIKHVDITELRSDPAVKSVQPESAWEGWHMHPARLEEGVSQHEKP